MINWVTELSTNNALPAQILSEEALKCRADRIAASQLRDAKANSRAAKLKQAQASARPAHKTVVHPSSNTVAARRLALMRGQPLPQDTASAVQSSQYINESFGDFSRSQSKSDPDPFDANFDIGQSSSSNAAGSGGYRPRAPSFEEGGPATASANSHFDPFALNDAPPLSQVATFDPFSSPSSSSSISFAHGAESFGDPFAQSGHQTIAASASASVSASAPSTTTLSAPAFASFGDTPAATQHTSVGGFDAFEDQSNPTQPSSFVSSSFQTGAFGATEFDAFNSPSAGGFADDGFGAFVNTTSTNSDGFDSFVAPSASNQHAQQGNVGFDSFEFPVSGAEPHAVTTATAPSSGHNVNRGEDSLFAGKVSFPNYLLRYFQKFGTFSSLARGIYFVLLFGIDFASPAPAQVNVSTSHDNPFDLFGDSTHHAPAAPSSVQSTAPPPPPALHSVAPDIFGDTLLVPVSTASTTPNNSTSTATKHSSTHKNPFDVLNLYDVPPPSKSVPIPSSTLRSTSISGMTGVKGGSTGSGLDDLQGFGPLASLPQQPVRGTSATMSRTRASIIVPSDPMGPSMMSTLPGSSVPPPFTNAMRGPAMSPGGLAPGIPVVSSRSSFIAPGPTTPTNTNVYAQQNRYGGTKDPFDVLKM